MKSSGNSYIFYIQENAFENVVCEMPAILSRPQCVKWNQTGLANKSLYWLYADRIYADRIYNCRIPSFISSRYYLKIGCRTVDCYILQTALLWVPSILEILAFLLEVLVWHDKCIQRRTALPWRSGSPEHNTYRGQEVYMTIRYICTGNTKTPYPM